jgi:methylthioxylose transferase
MLVTDAVPAARAPPRGPTVHPVSTVRTKTTDKKDVLVGVAAIGFVLLATAVGFLTGARNYGADLFSRAAARFGEYPILGDLYPRVAPASVVVVLIAVAAVVWGPALAERLRWRTVLAAGYALSVAWILALALVDGWQRGVAHKLAAGGEYLGVVGKVSDIPYFLDTFAGRILDFQPDSWPTHVSGHPPGATLVFVWLDRIGLSGGGAAGVVCVLAGAAVAVAVPVTVRALGREDLARVAVPFVALLPGAIWLGVSADAMFAGVTATGVALFAVGASRPSRLLCVAGGAVLGFGIFLSYGLLLMAPIALAVVLVTKNWRALMYAIPAALAVAAVFALAGFWWLDGYHLVVERYHQGVASHRPYWYWVWANFASLTLAVGPAAVAGLRRTSFLPVQGLPPVDALVRGAALAVLTASVSGLSKAEVERIWLPFAVWLVLAAVHLPAAARRRWLAAQAATAVVVNHVVLTSW